MSTPKQNPNIIPGDFSDRTLKGPSPVATTIFVGLRTADVLLQYGILSRGWATSLISRLGGQPTSPLALPGTASILGLQPYHAIAVSMALGSAIKHIVWMLFVNEQVMPLSGAFIISAFNTCINSISTVLSVWALTSLAPPPTATLDGYFKTLLSNPTIVIAIALYTTGVLTETVSEFQRKAFKSKKENKGKPYGGGLFSWATNINYGGYTLWRAGYAMFCAGWGWGLGLGALMGWDFATRAIPILDTYCTGRVRFSICAEMNKNLLTWIAVWAGLG
jgi:hypothetical protein